MKSKFEKISFFKFLLNSTLGWFSTLLCFIGIYLYIRFFAKILIQPYSILSFSGDYDFNSIFTYLSVGLMGSLFFFGGLPLGRLMLRIIPPVLSGERRIVAFVFATLIVVIGLVYAFYPFYYYNVAEQSFLFKSIVEKNKDLSKIDQIYSFFLFVSLTLGSALVFVIPHLNPRSFLEKPYILFLRRFSTFSDRSVLDALLKATHALKPVALLTSTQSKAGDWNPFCIGFSGLNIWHPIKSTPLYLRSSNESWKNSAEELIKTAEFITLDLSHGSGAIQSEIEMIENLNRWKNTIVLINQLKPEIDVTQQLFSYKNKGATIVNYKKSWGRGARLRLLLGIPFNLFLGGWLFSLLSLILKTMYFLFKGGLDAAINFYSIFLMGNLQKLTLDITNELSLVSQQANLLAFVISSIISLWVYFVFFVRPALDYQTINLLEEKFAQRDCT